MTKPPAPSRDISCLLRIMAALRTPETGCPWDLKQDFATIAPFTIEEAHEVADAIARGDMVDLEEELGDLLLQVVFHARMAEERGLFDFGDVVRGITAKMIRRHPHVFARDAQGDAESVRAEWERIKAEERAEKARRKGEDRSKGDGGLLADVPATLPALACAVKLQKKAGTVGFDWNDVNAVMNKLHEEVGEVEDELAGERDHDRLEDEIGDVLFVIANLARHLAIDPERALRGTNEKFRRRFRHIEAELDRRGRRLEEAELDEMEALWQAAKDIVDR